MNLIGKATSVEKVYVNFSWYLFNLFIKVKFIVLFNK